MTGQQFATILARTDPFDVAQGVERHIRSLSGTQVREVIASAQPRLNDWYRAEFVPLLDETDGDRLKNAFAHALKSNLRAIPLFGPEFCQGVIEHVPGDRAVGLGEEGRNWPVFRPAAVGVAAVAVFLGGATIQHLFSEARATVQAPVLLTTPVPALPPMAIHTPRAAPPPQVHRSAPPVHVAAAPVAAPVQGVPPPVPQPRPVHRVPHLVHTAPPGRGVKTVVVQETPAPSPTPQSVDVSDMPQSYSDATPLPNNQPPPQAHVVAPLSVATPTPEPNRSWTHRLVHAAVHLVNSTLSTVGVSKKPTPTPSPSGPKP